MARAAQAGVPNRKNNRRGQRPQGQSYTITMQVLFLLIGIVTGTALFFCKDWIIQLYEVTEQARELTLTFLTILSVTVVGTSYQMAALTGIVRGGGTRKFVLINDLIFMWGIVLPSSAICLLAQSTARGYVYLLKVRPDF